MGFDMISSRIVVFRMVWGKSGAKTKSGGERGSPCLIPFYFPGTPFSSTRRESWLKDHLDPVDPFAAKTPCFKDLRYCVMFNHIKCLVSCSIIYMVLLKNLHKFFNKERFTLGQTYLGPILYHRTTRRETDGLQLVEKSSQTPT